MEKQKAYDCLVQYQLRVTPQRLAVLEALLKMRGHPTAEQVAESIRKTHPNVATGTVYNILETLVNKGAIHKVRTENDIMRYDACKERHHHIYHRDSDQIEDYYDEELDQLLDDYFTRKGPNHFHIEELRLEISGTADKIHK